MSDLMILFIHFWRDKFIENDKWKKGIIRGSSEALSVLVGECNIETTQRPKIWILQFECSVKS